MELSSFMKLVGHIHFRSTSIRILCEAVIKTFIHLFIQQIFIESLPCARHCPRCWGCINKQRQTWSLLVNLTAGFPETKALSFEYLPVSRSPCSALPGTESELKHGNHRHHLSVLIIILINIMYDDCALTTY